MIEHGTGGAAYYADVLEAVVALAVGPPCGPPASAAGFLARLDGGWLAAAYASSPDGTDAALLRSASRHISDIALRFRTLFRRLGEGLDGPGGFGDADAWYCILEGTSEIAVAEAQARALVDILASYITHGPGSQREILLAVDEFSAVSRRLPIWQLYERARSLGLAVQVSAQSWPGLAPRDDDRYRIAAAADGGIWLLRTPHPEPATALAGSHRSADTSRRLLGAALWGHEGTNRSPTPPSSAASTPGRPPISTAAASPSSRSNASSPHPPHSPANRPQPGSHPAPRSRWPGSPGRPAKESAVLPRPRRARPGQHPRRTPGPCLTKHSARTSFPETLARSSLPDLYLRAL
jgi:hypothetical protein